MALTKRILLLGLLAAVMTVLPACHGGAGEEPEASYTTLVTYVGTDKDLQVSTFTYQTINDSPLITLTANWIPTTELKEGERVLLVYNSDSYGSSGPVKVKYVAPVIGWTPKVLTEPATGNISVSPVSYWRSGPYFNAYVEATMTREPATVTFGLLESTANDPMPTYYLAISQTNVKEIEAIRRIATLSFDVSASWNRPDCTGIKVIYRDIYNEPAHLQILKTK